MQTPQVSIVIPVYNAGPFLLDAVASMVEQTFSNWEMICVNDGSRDASAQVLDWFALQDSRIRVLHQENQGIVAALNAGCSQANSAWICRMDADDVAFPDRLQKQVDYVSEHPKCVAVGSAILEMDSQSRPLGIQRLPIDHDSIESRLLSGRPGLFHPTALIQRAPFRSVGEYRKEFQWVEDHDLWMRLAKIGKLANLSEPLLCYRLHASSICGQRRKSQSDLMELLLQTPKGRDNIQPEAMLPGEKLEGNKPTEHAPAGPGKWARVAMRGGYPHVAAHQMRQLFREQGLSRYFLRMAVEMAIRAIPSLGKMLTKKPLSVPDLSHWHQRFADSQ